MAQLPPAPNPMPVPPPVPPPVPVPVPSSAAPSAPATASDTAPIPVPTIPIAPAAQPAHPSSRSERTRQQAGAGGALQDDSLATLLLRIDRYCQHLLDRVAPFKLQRWLALTALLAIFLLRMFLLEGFYIVAYVLFIFILNQFILFLQPKDRAALVARMANPEDNESEATTTTAALPTLDDDEFRPFVRRLPEFKFWYSTTYATVLAFCATFFRAFDVPVFWPLLLFYFVLLFVATMRRQWLDMKKLKYVPWDIGTKKVYKSDPKRVSVTRSTPPPTAQNALATARAPAPVPTLPVTPKKSAAPPAQPAQPILT